MPEKKIFTSSFNQDHFQFKVLSIFRISKDIIAIKLHIQSKGDLKSGCIFVFHIKVQNWH